MERSALVLRLQIDEDAARLAEQPSGYALRRVEPDRRVPLTVPGAEPVVVPKRDVIGDRNERVDTRVLERVFRLGDGAGAALRAGETLDGFVEAET